MDPVLRLDALDALAAAADRAKRSGNVAFPPSFVRAEHGRPALARLIQGGQGGRIRLPLYLDIVMMATRYPHSLTGNSPQLATWCKMLGIPEDVGCRRVSANLRRLVRDEVIELEPRPAQTPAIHLLDPLNSREKFSTKGSRYVGVPIEFWTKGWVLNLSPTAIAVLLALLELLGGRDEAQYISRYRRGMYGLSDDTWTKARKELVDHRLLTVDRKECGTGSDLKRLRNKYWIDRSVLIEGRADVRQG